MSKRLLLLRTLAEILRIKRLRGLGCLRYPGLAYHTDQSGYNAMQQSYLMVKGAQVETSNQKLGQLVERTGRAQSDISSLKCRPV